MHYGVSVQWGPNTLIYNTKKVKPAPTSWGAIYSSKYKGKLTVPNNPIQIADAALYLMQTKPSLGIKDPYELTKAQLDGGRQPARSAEAAAQAVLELRRRRDHVVQERRRVIGAGWPYQTLQLQGDKQPVKEIVPLATTGWADTWMLAARLRIRTARTSG